MPRPPTYAAPQALIAMPAGGCQPAIGAALQSALPPMDDPDLDELHRKAKALSVAARFRDRPPIEIRARDRACSLLASFATAQAALRWLQPRQEHDE